MCRYVVATRLGRLLVAVRDNESRLRFAGYQPVTIKAFAFTLAAQFANTTTGTAPGTGVPPGTIVPVEQINTIGNIIAACVNSPGGTSGDTTPCGMLFSLTTPPGLTPATNTAAALLHLANDPTLNTASLYNLVTPSAPFQPSLPQVPADLSVRLTVPSGFTVSPAEIDFPATRLGSTSIPLSFTFTNNTAAPVGIDIAALTYFGPNLSDLRHKFRRHFKTGTRALRLGRRRHSRSGRSLPLLPFLQKVLQTALQHRDPFLQSPDLILIIHVGGAGCPQTQQSK